MHNVCLVIFFTVRGFYCLHVLEILAHFVDFILSDFVGYCMDLLQQDFNAFEIHMHLQAYCHIPIIIELIPQ